MLKIGDLWKNADLYFTKIRELADATGAFGPTDGFKPIGGLLLVELIADGPEVGFEIAPFVVRMGF